MSENNDLTYYQRNRDMILSKARDKYQNLSEEDKIKEREYVKNRIIICLKKIKLKKREQARDKYRNLSEEDKNKKGEYAKNRYDNMSDKKKSKIKRPPKKKKKKNREARV